MSLEDRIGDLERRRRDSSPYDSMTDEELVVELRRDPDSHGDPNMIGSHLSNRQLADLLEKRRGN